MYAIRMYDTCYMFTYAWDGCRNIATARVGKDRLKTHCWYVTLYIGKHNENLSILRTEALSMGNNQQCTFQLAQEAGSTYQPAKRNSCRWRNQGKGK
mmetsp:Transcript_11209/g.21502  ORF Transcript_11209/g.21502 Transcript_11209/m.21502 type:complete len:97 (+) Transcript_11209:45-335(+)